MFISGSSDGWNQRFHKQKSQFLQLNGAGKVKKRRRLHHKCWSSACLLVGMGDPVKVHVEMGWIRYLISKSRSLMCLTKPFWLKYSDLHKKEGKKINISNPLTETQSQSSLFLSFMMMVYLEQADTKCKHSCMTCRACVQLQLDVDEVDDSIDTQILPPPIFFYSICWLFTIVEIQILAQSRNIGWTYFHNAAPKYLQKIFYIMSMKYYFKW